MMKRKQLHQAGAWRNGNVCLPFCKPAAFVLLQLSSPEVYFPPAGRFFSQKSAMVL